MNDAPGARTIGAKATLSTIIIVDQRVEGWEALLQGRAQGARVVLLDPDQDGLEQMAAIVSSASSLDSIQIVSHGEAGVLQIGSRPVDLQALDEGASHLAAISAALKPGGDILLYGCKVGAGEAGLAFVSAFASLYSLGDRSATNAPLRISRRSGRRGRVAIPVARDPCQRMGRVG